MKGSEKQVAWATDILNGEISTVERNLDGIRQDIADFGETHPEWLVKYRARQVANTYVLAALRTLDDAKWIIDNQAGLRLRMFRPILSTLTAEDAETVKAWMLVLRADGYNNDQIISNLL